MDVAGEERSRQDERRRKLERMKIKLEESGLGSSSEVLKEHQETTERDEFLARETGRHPLIVPVVVEV